MKSFRKTITVGVDARPLSYAISGVSRVISRILLHFPDTNRYRFVLYSNRPPHPDFSDVVNLKNVEWKQGTGFFSRYGGTWFNLSLPFEIKKNPVDIFWGSQQVLPPLLPSGIPAVLTYYDLVLYFYPDAMRFLARIQQRIFQSYSVRRSERILSISTQTKLDMIQKFGYPEDRAKVSLLGYEIPSGSSRRRKMKNRNLPPEGSYILSVSTMEPRKNYGVLLEAYENYRKLKKNPLNLVIAGRRGWESPAFFEKLDQLITEGGLITFENADDSVIEELYRNCAFFVMPSVYEGFGLTLLEALCHGKFAVASDIGPFREIGGDSIEYVRAVDVTEWTEALERNSEKFLKGKLKLRNFSSSSWTWDRTAKMHHEAFEEVSEIISQLPSKTTPSAI